MKKITQPILGVSVSVLISACSFTSKGNFAPAPGEKNYIPEVHEARWNSLKFNPLDKQVLYALYQKEPTLYELYFSYPGKLSILSRYAFEQGYLSSVERVGITLHELIHIASADAKAVVL